MLDLRYSLYGVAYLLTISSLVSRLERPTSGNGVAAQLAASVYHAPLYAGLAFFVLQAISRGRMLAGPQWARVTLAFAVTGAVAAIDEWYRASVLPRWPLPVGVLWDLLGIAGLLLVCLLGTSREAVRR
ncbi:MAG TPA: VanZ family protein [bacterium]|nr:VanZ family protein [bacterium]